jgi:hypothetical protein
VTVAIVSPPAQVLPAAAWREQGDYPLRHQHSRLDSAAAALPLRGIAIEEASSEDLLDAYPRLTREDIKAAIGYAGDTG